MKKGRTVKSPNTNNIIIVIVNRAQFTSPPLSSYESLQSIKIAPAVGDAVVDAAVWSLINDNVVCN